jgi:hypothetical protein
VVLAILARLWWIIGRDRWYGDIAHAAEGASEETKPLFAHQTVPVQYTPPESPNGEKRRLRPAEVGLLMDERADTLDVSATIVDLAVRKHLIIKQVEKDGLLSMFQSRDYELKRIDHPSVPLLAYERKLLNALFADGVTVRLSDLKGEFNDDLAGVKESLYEQAVRKDKLFPADPEKVRGRYRLGGAAVATIGGLLTYGLGIWFEAGIVGLPVFAAGLLLLLLAQFMPRRTPAGWEAYRRALGFRTYMVTAETDRQRFAEQEQIFHEYLPYAIVFGCVDKWAHTFEALEIAPEAGYYVGTHPFTPVSFATDLREFSSGLSGVMTATPGGSGSSGFSGGFSGGGGGGGGVGSW